MSDDDEYYPRHLLRALGLLDTDVESEHNESENVDNESEDSFPSDDENEGNNSEVLENAHNTHCPYICYALGLDDFPEENESSEDDEVLTTDSEREVSHEEHDFQGNDTYLDSEDVSIYDDDEIEENDSDN